MMVRIKTHGGKTEMVRRRRKGSDTRVDGQIQTEIRRMKRWWSWHKTSITDDDEGVARMETE